MKTLELVLQALRNFDHPVTLAEVEREMFRITGTGALSGVGKILHHLRRDGKATLLKPPKKGRANMWSSRTDDSAFEHVSTNGVAMIMVNVFENCGNIEFWRNCVKMKEPSVAGDILEIEGTTYRLEDVDSVDYTTTPPNVNAYAVFGKR